MYMNYFQGFVLEVTAMISSQFYYFLHEYIYFHI